MRNSRWFWVLPVLLSLLASFSADRAALAGTTGKLTGRVMDASSGSPLPGVNVVIEGTRRGAMSDEDGYYLILSVDPGTYTLTASMMGYGAVAKTDVKVAADFTATVDFQLKETTLEIAEMVVVAERPPVEPDKTTSHYVMTSEQVEQVPMARSLADLVALNPGVKLTNATIIRGGDSKDAAYFVDGVRLYNNDVYGRQFTGINRTAVQEITVISGGANAEYGNLESGAISVVTKEGGRQYQGWTDLRYTPPGKKHWGEDLYVNAFHKDKVKWGDKEWVAETVVLDPGADGLTGTPDDEIGLAHRKIDYTDTKGAYIEGGLSGPIGDRTSFFGSARWTKQPRDVNVTSGENAGFPVLQSPFDIRGNGKLTFRPTADLKLSVGGIYSRADGYNQGPSGTDVVLRDLRTSGQNIFLPDGSGSGRSRITDNMLYATLTHTISPKTFYEVKLGWYSTKQDTLDIPNATDAFGFLIPTPVVKDLDGWFNVKPAQAVNFTIADRTRLSLKADLSSQVTRGHFMKAGLEATHYDLYYYNYSAPSAASRAVDYVNRVGHLPDDKAPLNPMQLAVYVQDKMEFEGMVLNAGLRFDAFYTNTEFYNVSQLQSPQYRWLIFHKNMPTVPARWATQLSPRFGISHPITERSAFHFTAGLYTNLPDFYTFFRERWIANGSDAHLAWDAFSGLRNQNQMANPYIEYMRTRAYEAGADWNFVADYTAGISAYYKSAIDKVSSGSRYWFEPAGYTYVWGLKPVQYQDMKGFEVSVRKAFSHFFSFNTAINFGWSTYATVGSNATMFFPDSLYVANPDLYYDWTWDAATSQYVKKFPSEADIKRLGAQANTYWRTYENNMLNVYEAVTFEFLDVQDAYDAPAEMKGNWQPSYGGARLFDPKGGDQRTQASMSVYFQSPAEFGPELREFYLLGDLRANLVWRIESGNAVWYTPPGKQQELRHRPIRDWTDLQVEKTLVRSGPREAVAYVEVFNLFNQKDSSAPYNYPDYVRWGMNIPRPDDQDYLSYGDYNELFRYAGQPRATYVGLKFTF